MSAKNPKSDKEVLAADRKSVRKATVKAANLAAKVTREQTEAKDKKKK